MRRTNGTAVIITAGRRAATRPEFILQPCLCCSNGYRDRDCVAPRNDRVRRLPYGQFAYGGGPTCNERL